MLNTADRLHYGPEHQALRDSVRRLLDEHAHPNLARWEAEKRVDRGFYRRCGEQGLMGPSVPEEYGGLGLDFTYNAVITEEFAYAGVNIGVLLQSDIVLPYLLDYGTEEQKRRYATPMARGETIGAIAMTEPGAGSDLQGMRTTARRDGGDWVLNGSKTYISNGQQCDTVIVAAKTASGRGSGTISLFVVEADAPGFRRGRNLDKIGQWSGDTSELFFDDLRVPAGNLLGGEGGGFACLMGELVQERLSIAIGAQAAAQRAFDLALDFTRSRPAFGKTVFDLQNTRFTLADLAARLQVGWAHVDVALGKYLAGTLTPAAASAAKYWHTETQWQVADAALQLHGGAGYMNEYEIARLWRDARVQRIYGGTSQIMLEVVGRAL